MLDTYIDYMGAATCDLLSRAEDRGRAADMARTACNCNGLDVPMSRRVFTAAAGALPLLLSGCSGRGEVAAREGSAARGRRARQKAHAKIARAAWPQAAADEIGALMKPYTGNVSLACVPLDAATFVPLKGGIAIDSAARRTAASLIKLAVLAAAIEAAAVGALSLDERVTVTEEDIVGGAGDIQAKGAGATYTVDELLHAMIAQSDNTAANLIIGKLGMEAVNAECTRLHLKQTELQRLMMDMSARQAER